MSYQRTYYATRRQQSWGRNQNTTRFISRVKLGPVMHTIIVALMILVMGLVYLAQAAGSANYDYAASDFDKKISELSTKKADLEVENDRKSTRLNSSHSNIAKAMSAPSSAEHVQ